DDRDAGMADQRGEPTQEPQEPEAQRAQPEPEPGEEQSSELRIGAGQGSVLERTGIERVAPREWPELLRQPHGGTRAVPGLEIAGGARANEQGPEAAAESHPSPRAEGPRLPGFVPRHATGG